MKNYKKAFIQTAIKSGALCFGRYELKSGRISPYFFNAGLLYQGEALSVLSQAYAQAIAESRLEFDVIFGPAYKGIALAAITSVALFEKHGMDIPFAYNRKEEKAHGEGGQLVGAPLTGKRVLVIDDVITAGTAIREVAAVIERQNARLSAVIVGLNRQERGNTMLSAIQEVERDFLIPVINIVKLEDIVEYLEENSFAADIDSIRLYQKKYGALL